MPHGDGARMFRRGALASLALITVFFAGCAHKAADKAGVRIVQRDGCDVDAAVVRSGLPEFPELLRRPGHPLEWTVEVNVLLDAAGRVRHVAVSRSYGQTSLDPTVVRLALNAEAVKQARSATYRPKIVHCKAVPSTFDYHITFTGA